MPTSLDANFVETMDKLVEDSYEVYLLHRDGVGGAWSLPVVSANGWTGDLFDFTSLGLAFNRTGIESEYRTAIEKSVIESNAEDAPKRGTTNDLAANKIQAGILSQRERAFRARHTTPIMAACYAAARRKGHGESDEEATGVFGVIVNHVADMINYGG